MLHMYGKDEIIFQIFPMCNWLTTLIKNKWMGKVNCVSVIWEFFSLYILNVSGDKEHTR